MMSFIESESPPGVSIRITRAAAWSLSAREIESLTKLADTGLISVLSRIARTSGRPSVAAFAGPAARSGEECEGRDRCDQDPSWHSASVSRKCSRRVSPPTRTAVTSAEVCGRPSTTSRPDASTPVQAPVAPPASSTRRPRSSSRSRPVNPSPLEAHVAGLDRGDQIGQELRAVDRRAAQDPQRRRLDARARRKLGGGEVRVHPHPDDEPALAQLRQHAGQLAPADDDVVRPAHLRLRPGRLADGLGDHQAERGQPLGRRAPARARARRAPPRPTG